MLIKGGDADNMRHGNTLSDDKFEGVVVKGGTLWMTQKPMAKLYAVNVPDISKHLKNIYETGEQKVEATVSKMEIVQQEGKRKVKRT